MPGVYACSRCGNNRQSKKRTYHHVLEQRQQTKFELKCTLWFRHMWNVRTCCVHVHASLLHSSTLQTMCIYLTYTLLHAPLQNHFDLPNLQMCLIWNHPEHGVRPFVASNRAPVDHRCTFSLMHSLKTILHDSYPYHNSTYIVE